MLDLLFYLFIYPIESLMKFILSVMFSLTNNHGFTIILLSIIINIIILPLYYLAEKLKKDNQSILSILQPQIDFFKKKCKGQEKHYFIQTLYRVNNYHPISSINASLGLLLQIPFFIAAFHLLGNYQLFDGVNFLFIQDLNKPDNLLLGLNLLPILMTIINLLSAYIYAKNMDKSDVYQLWGLSAIFLVLLYFESSALLLYWTMNNLFSLAKNFIEDRFNLNNFRTKAISLLTIPFYAIKNNKILNFIVKDIYIQAIILFFGTIFIYKAIPMAASDTGMYLASYPMVALSLIVFFLICIFVAYFIYYFSPKKLKYILMVLAVYGALSGLFYSFVNPLELGAMTALEIPNFANARVGWNAILFSLALAVSLMILLFFIFNKTKKIILIIIVFSNLILIVQTLSLAFNPKTINIVFDKTNKMFFNTSIDKEKLKKAYSFSKESNVIVILMDMFQGNMLYDLLNKYPKFKQDLSGFTYYPNTLSIGSKTELSMGSVIGGKEYIKYRHKGQKEYKDRYKKSNLKSMAIADKYDYSYMRYRPFGIKCDILSSYNNNVCLEQNDVVFNNKKAKELKKNIQYEYDKTTSSPELTAMVFSQISFILNMPHNLKRNTLLTLFKISDKTIYFSRLAYYLQLTNMSDFVNAQSKRKTFKIIHNNITHDSWLMNKKCEVTKNIYRGYDGFFTTANCSLKLLINFFDKLKKLNIYDKTKIIIVSDHGTVNRAKSKISPIDMSSSSALMLIKDFNSKGEMNISNIFLSNMDTYGISLSGLSKNIEIDLDPTKNLMENRNLTFTRFDLKSPKKPLKVFKVKNNIFNKKNWIELDKNEIEKLDSNK